MTSEPLTISASQLATAWDCERKWWLERVARMPDVPKGYLTFGTVLHACLERWCSADEQGRVPDGPMNCDAVLTEGPLMGQEPGQPATPFPVGWEEVEERGVRSRVTPNEAALIRRLVEQAVERGLVQRGDGRVLERELRLPVIEGVDLVGFVDIHKPAGERQPHGGPPITWTQDIPQIHDHKTFGEGSVRFLKQPNTDSPNYLGKDEQLLTYAAATSLIDGWAGPVVVRHNQFPKFEDPRGPRSVEAVVPREAWAKHWKRVQATATRLLQVREIKKWDDVPGPYGSDVCQKYGGCPFREICGRRATLDGFRASIERRKVESGTRPNLSTAPRRRLDQMTNKADVFANAPRRGAAQPAQPAPKGNDITSSQGAKAVEVASAPVALAASNPGINGGVLPVAAPATLPGGYVPPPWANPACSACKGLGFNSKGRPCPICDALAKRSKRPTSSMYTVEGSMHEGFTAVGRSEKTADLFALSAPESWSSKAGAIKSSTAGGATQAQGSPPATAGEAPGVLPAVQPIITGSTPAECDAKAALVVAAQEAAAPVIEKSVEETAGTKRGRPKAGVTILVGCAQLKGPDRPTTTVQELLLKLGAELAKDMGAGSYWELDAFKRRDRIRQKAETIAEGLGRTVLLVPGIQDPDADSLVGALLPFADLVIEGVR